MTRVVGWTVWYEDTFYDSRESDWESIPDDGVQVVYIYKSDGRREGMRGATSYYCIDGQVWDSDRDRPKDVIKRYPGAVIKRGKRILLERFEEIQKQAADYKWQ